MKTLTLSTEQFNNDTVVSNIFIDKYMCDANGEFVKVYLYLLRSMALGNVGLSDVADRLNLTEKDVIRALKYWDKQKVLKVTFSGKNEPEAIVFVNLNEDAEYMEQQAATITPVVVEEAKTPEIPEKVKYSPAQVRRLKEQDEIKELLFIVEQLLGRALNGADVSTILFIHKSLNFSVDLIEYLIEYCVTNNHTSMAYIETVALAWVDRGITNVADAKSSAAIYNKRTSVVTRSFGLTNRTLTPVELDFINRWYDEYGFVEEVIEEACKRTIMSMSKPNFSYADGILKKWKTANVRNLDDVKKVDSGFRASITIPVGTKPAPATTSNKFNNIPQRTYNFEEMEKKLIGNNK